MKPICLILFFLVFKTGVQAQYQNDVTFSGGMGFYYSPKYTNADAGDIALIEANYNVTEKQILAFRFSTARHYYYDLKYSNTNEPSKDLINSFGYVKMYSLLYKREMVRDRKFAFLAGAGAGLFKETLKYPYYYEETREYDYRQKSFSRLILPLVMEGNYQLFKRFGAGLFAGAYLHPDFPVAGLDLGIKLSYKER